MPDPIRPGTVPSFGLQVDPYPFLDPPDRAGDLGTLGGLRVTAELGQGGMGLVFRAEDPKLRRTVAVKVMRPEVASKPVARARFVREARAQAAVEHDHVLPIHQVDDGPTPYLVMPLLKGQPLSTALRNDPRPRPLEVCRIIREIADGLAAAHTRGLIHRDIKPGNIWLEGDRRRVKILDFGLARVADDEPDSATGSGQSLLGSGTELTRTGGVLGTPAYMAPEQAKGEPVDHRADLFSLGVMLFQMTAGRLPFGGRTAAEMIASVIAVPTPPLPPDVPAPLAELAVRLMSKNPADRPTSAAAVVEAVREAERVIAPPRYNSVPEVWETVANSTEDHPVLPADRPPSPARRLGLLWGLLAVAVLAAGGAVVWRTVGRRTPSPEPVVGKPKDAPKLAAVPKAEPVKARPPTEFREVRGLTEDGLLPWVKGLPAGWGPVWVATRVGTDPPWFDAVAVPTPGATDWSVVTFSVGTGERAEVTAQMRETGQRHVHRFLFARDEAVVVGSTQARMTGPDDAPVWAGGPRAGDLTATNNRATPIVKGRLGPDRLTQARDQGRWPAAFCGVRLAGDGMMRETVMLRPSATPVGWELERELVAAGLRRKADDARAAGRWPAVVSGAVGVSPPQYLAVFADNKPAVEWDLVVQQPEAEYEASLAARRAAGWLPRSLTGVTTDGATRFTVVWIRTP